MTIWQFASPGLSVAKRSVSMCHDHELVNVCLELVSINIAVF
jgi:hypothetical protein